MLAHRVARPRIRSMATTLSATVWATEKANQFGATTLARNSFKPGIGLSAAADWISLRIHSTLCHFVLAK